MTADSPTEARTASSSASTSPRAYDVLAPSPTRTTQKASPSGYLMCIPEIAREITSCWISAVPSKMS